MLATFILGAVGVLDDVTVTQAALVEELSRSGGLFGRTLFARAMGVGRTHIAATVNTLFLAYVGAGLPLLVVIVVSQQPTALLANQELIATEMARTLVGSLGIVAAVPFTTFVATLLADDAPAPAAGWSRPAASSVPVVAIVGGIVAAMLLATALLPLSGETRAPFREPIFVPGGSTAPLASDFATGTPAADRGDPVLLEAGEPMPINLAGTDVGTVTVVEVTRRSGDSAAEREAVSILIRYDATAPFDLSSGTWALFAADGTELPIEPREGAAALNRTLPPGESLVVTLDGELPADEGEPFVVFVDRLTTRLIFAVSLG